MMDTLVMWVTCQLLRLKGWQTFMDSMMKCPTLSVKNTFAAKVFNSRDNTKGAQKQFRHRNSPVKAKAAKLWVFSFD